MSFANTALRSLLSVMACDVGALDPQVRAEHFGWIRGELPGLIQKITELPNGVELQLPVEALPQVALFIDRERRCCRFLNFVVEVNATGQLLQLRLTGPSGVPDILRAALNLRVTR